MESHLHWADYLILIGFLVISLAIGVYHSLTGGRQKTTNEFIMGNRKLSVIPTAISALVSFMSAITLLGSTAEMYGYGIQFLIFCMVAAPLSLLIVERFIVPWLYPLKLISIYDYLEKRYMSKTVRIFGSSLGMFSGVLFMGVVMYAPSAALQSASGLPISVSIPVMAVVSVIYTALGGMRAVIWTDVFQFLIMFGGMVAILVKGLIVVGGFENVFQLAGGEGRLIWANVSVDPRDRNTVWSLLIGLSINWIQAYGLLQAAVQRFSAVDQLSKARTMILINIPPLMIMTAMACVIGLTVLAYYSSIKCDPLANKDISNPNELLPYFVVTIFAESPGFAGPFLSALYGAALSTVSSTLSGSAANFWEDILKRKLSHLQETRKALINRFLVVLFGTLSTGVAFIATLFPGPLTQVAMAMFSSVNGPLLGIFFLGGVSRHAHWKGALLGGIAGVTATLWLSIGSTTVRHKHSPPLPPVSVEQCSSGNANSTLFASSFNYTNHITSFEIFEGIGANDTWNQTEETLQASETEVTRLRGLENFYAISYLWLTLFGAVVTGVVGIAASLITRDKELEAKVERRFLLRVNICGWSEDGENLEDLVDDHCVSLQEIKGLNRPDDSFLKDVEMSLKEIENGFHKEFKNDLTKETKDNLPKDCIVKSPLLNSSQ